MKKALLLLASAALILAGCAKDSFQKRGGDGEQTVTITVGLPDTGTRAVSDNDGNAAKANHWIMEVLDAQDQLFYRKDTVVATAGTMTMTFKVSLIKNQSYNLLFWADNNGGYYDTEDLTNVTLTDEATYAGNIDARDAFAACKAYTSTANEKLSVKLYRPFAQVNVVTTDLPTLWAQAGTTGSQEQTYIKFEPSNYVAVVNVPTSFNVKTQQCGAASPVTITSANTYTGYEADGTTAKTKNNYELHQNPATLFMDYVFASKGQKDVVDLAFECISNGQKIQYAFTAIPLQANYRTNISGKLLSNETEWLVEIAPTWNEPSFPVPYKEETVDNIAGLNEVLASDEAGSAKDLNITTTMPSDSDTENVTFTDNNDQQNITLKFEGELGAGKTIVFDNNGTEGPSSLTIDAPAGTSLLFNDQMPHVVINGVEYNNISGAFSANTLIIEKGVTVASLTIAEGGLEIHGTVTAVEVVAPKAVVVRDCEGLSQEVYDVLKEYIAEGYVAKQNGNKWDIVPAENWINYAASSFLKVEGKNITINSAEQLALLAKNVLEGNTYEGYTIKLAANIDLAGKEWTPVGLHSYRTNCSDKNSTVTISKPFNGVFDGNGFAVSNMKISVAENGKAYNGAGLFGYMTAGTIKNVTVTNPDIEGRLYVGAVVGFPYTGTAIENCVVNGDIKIVASWYCGGIAGNGYITTIKDCSVKGETGSYIKGVATKYNDGTAGYFGGIIGFRGEGGQVVENCAVENIDITAECNGVGGIAGILHYGNTVKNCSLENVNVKMDTDDADETPKVALYAGSSTGTENAIGWCINNTATNCTVKTKSSDVNKFVGTKGSNCENPVHVAGYDVEFNKDGKVIAGLFQAIPASVVAKGYKIVEKEPGLYEVKESESWVDHAADEYAAKDPSGKTITIANAAQLALFRNELAADYVQYAGYTVSLSADIDLGKYIWEPILEISVKEFDGANHTIANMTVKADNGFGNAFISYVYGTTIKNVTFDKATVQKGSGAFSGNVYAVVAAYSGYYANATFEKVIVKNSMVWAYGKIGAIAGMAEMQGNTLKFKDCKVENTTLKGVYNVGGLIGNFQYQVSDCRNTLIIENSSDVDYTFVTDELPDRNFSSVTTIDELTGNYLVSGQWFYAQAAKYYNEYNTPVADKYNADALIHNTPDNIIPE